MIRFIERAKVQSIWYGNRYLGRLELIGDRWFYVPPQRIKTTLYANDLIEISTKLLELNK